WRRNGHRPMRGFCHVKYLEVSDVKNLGQIGKLPFGKLPRRNPNPYQPSKECLVGSDLVYGS
ncbi:hypothetical protein HZ326_29034, partial [Fusarium oxysporum f. sp. albedinis]